MIWSYARNRNCRITLFGHVYITFIYRNSLREKRSFGEKLYWILKVNTFNSDLQPVSFSSPPSLLWRRGARHNEHKKNPLLSPFRKGEAQRSGAGGFLLCEIFLNKYSPKKVNSKSPQKTTQKLLFTVVFCILTQILLYTILVILYLFLIEHLYETDTKYL